MVFVEKVFVKSVILSHITDLLIISSKYLQASQVHVLGFQKCYFSQEFLHPHQHLFCSSYY